MDPIETILSVLAPHECLGCFSEGNLLCKSCFAKLPTIQARCYICRNPSEKFATCQECRKNSHIDTLYPATVYSNLGKEMIVRLKLAGARSAAKNMAQIITERYDLPANAVLVPLPTASSRTRWRGFDQARLLSREISRITGLGRQDLFVRYGQISQHGSSRNERLKHLSRAYVLKSKSNLPRSIILVDDVITTGATMETAAHLLRQAGVKHVSGLVFAQPELHKKQ